jgi:hypothetical protein
MKNERMGHRLKTSNKDNMSVPGISSMVTSWKDVRFTRDPANRNQTRAKGRKIRAWSEVGCKSLESPSIFPRCVFILLPRAVFHSFTISS